MSHPERIVPDDAEPGIVAIHRKRYEFALPHCEGKDVLDAACGVGYGTAVLAERAQRAVGIDRDPAAIAYARSRYGSANIEFAVQDLDVLDLPDESFDVVCSFETIEHLDEPKRFLAHARRVLRPGGLFFASTPQVDVTTEAPDNPFHRIELARADFEQLLALFFTDVDVYGQYRLQTRRHRAMQKLDVLGLRKRLTFLRPASKVLGTAPMAEVSTDGIAIDKAGLDRATELVAVCRRG
jgi:2-polyprenyl-3-methyl-5-hydroxy-6-metoxy-1,4-benzoquinol methylase